MGLCLKNTMVAQEVKAEEPGLQSTNSAATITESVSNFAPERKRGKEEEPRKFFIARSWAPANSRQQRS